MLTSFAIIPYKNTTNSLQEFASDRSVSMTARRLHYCLRQYLFPNFVKKSCEIKKVLPIRT